MAARFARAYTHGAMKSYHASLSPRARALVAAAVVLATGSVATLAQTPDQDSTNASTNGSNYQSDQNNNATTPDMNSAANGTSNSNATANDMAGNANSSGAQDNLSNSSTSHASGKLSWSDRHFLSKLSEKNQNEIQIAQLALQKSNNQDVKNYAQTLMQDHTAMGQQLQSLAANTDVKLKTPKASEHDHMYNKLNKQSGTDFDQQFVKEMVSDHKKDIKDFQDRADDSKDPAVKSFVQQQIPKLQHHLQIAQQLEQSIVPTGRSGSNSWRQSSGTTGANAVGTASTGADSVGTGSTDAGPSSANASGMSSGSSATSSQNGATSSSGTSATSSTSP